MSFDGGSELVLVVGAGEPAPSFSRQGVEGLVRGPEDGEGLVDGHLEQRQNACILQGEDTVQADRTLCVTSH